MARQWSCLRDAAQSAWPWERQCDIKEYFNLSSVTTQGGRRHASPLVLVLVLIFLSVL
jgi:hypothetical protein